MMLFAKDIGLPNDRTIDFHISTGERSHTYLTLHSLQVCVWEEGEGERGAIGHTKTRNAFT
jgi:hypothetical protein